MTEPTRGDWQAHGLCVTRESRDWFPELLPARERPAAETAAKAVCAECPVRQTCLHDALAYRANGAQFGVRGGYSARERRRMINRRTRPRKAVCGTDGGYRRHLRDNTPPCDECRHAHTTAESIRRETRRANQ